MTTRMERYVRGSLAERLDADVAVVRTPAGARRSARPRLTVLPSTGTRQHAETYLSPLAVTILRCVVAFGVCLALASVARIALIAACFSVVTENSALSSQIDEARAAGDELEIEQAVYGSSERVYSIATDVYGMVPAGSVTTMSVADDASAGQAAQAQAE